MRRLEHKLVSFVIPAYNAADTIVRCLESIYALSLKPDELEVIVVDDASTDQTCDMVTFYQSNHPNITLLRQQENHRQGAARNRGVKVAKGEYICFVDADDAVTEGFVSAILLAKEKGADMVALHYAFVNERGVITKEANRLSFTHGEVFSGIEMQNRHPYWCSAPWAYVYNREYLNRVNYPFAEDVLYEDSDFVVNHLYRAIRMAYTKDVGYLMYYREGSTTHSNNYKNVADYLLLGVRMMEFYERITNEHLANEELEKFAEGILEGACWNVGKSTERLIKLPNIQEVKAFYQRIDSKINREVLYKGDKYHRYYWNIWMGLCVGHKNITIWLLAFSIPLYRLLK